MSRVAKFDESHECQKGSNSLIYDDISKSFRNAKIWPYFMPSLSR